MPKAQCSTDGFAVSFSDGSVSIFHPRQSQKALRDVQSEKDLEELELPNDPNPIEVWYIAFDQTPTISKPCNLYAGDDFGALRCHQLVQSDDIDEDEESPKEFGSLFPAQVQQSSTDRGRFHTAGVTAILPLRESNSTDGSGSKIVVTGSYDEYIRVYKHSPIPREREVLAELCLEGGVWRLRLLLDKTNQEDNVRSLLIYASCMHAGSRIVRIEHDMTADSWNIAVLAKFTEHESMNYASGVWNANALDSAADESTTRRLTCVSSSFYDKRLCLWQVDI